MFNFSANHVFLISKQNFKNYYIYIVKDLDTKRIYKVYNFSKSIILAFEKVYCISGKINSADKFYLVLENAKEDIRYYQNYKDFKEQIHT